MSTLREALAQTRREIIINALVAAGNNRTHAAQALGVEPRTIFRFVAEELTSHDRDVIAAKCLNLGGIDPKSAAGATRA